jgi:hypothetical protein
MHLCSFTCKGMTRRLRLKPPRPHPVQLSGAAHQPVDSQQTPLRGTVNGEQFPSKRESDAMIATT